MARGYDIQQQPVEIRIVQLGPREISGDKLAQLGQLNREIITLIFRSFFKN